MTDVTSLHSWQALARHAAKCKNTHLNTLFAQDAARFEKYALKLPQMLVDFSKQRVDDEAHALLLSLARDVKIEHRRDAMFAGEKINTTENRAVLHTALRAENGAVITVDGKNIVPEVRNVLARMEDFSSRLHTGAWTGFGGQAITDVVNIGIGGSSLGPQLAAQALRAYHHPRLRVHFAANVEASDLACTLQGLSPETTLFVIASKTFTTAETMQNAHIARTWVHAHYKNDACIARHFVAASTNAQAVGAFGIALENMFPFWDWVGGRYSVWSAIGLSVMLAIGAENFSAFLAGARAMDAHFKTAPLEKNAPVQMALFGLWNRNFLNMPAQAVIPYHASLARLPAFLQQLDMESNGKSVTGAGARVSTATGPLIFGEPGTDAQHSFFQWLHQGTDIVPVDFIAALKTPYGGKEQHAMLLANMLAQSEALMTGHENAQEPHRSFSGNRPSTTILLNELSPFTLGMVLALYEHKVFVQGCVWGIDSFDQWGVELGKVMAKTLEKEFKTGIAGAHDSSTTGLFNHIISTK